MTFTIVEAVVLFVILSILVALVSAIWVAVRAVRLSRQKNWYVEQYHIRPYPPVEEERKVSDGTHEA